MKTRMTLRQTWIKNIRTEINIETQLMWREVMEIRGKKEGMRNGGRREGEKVGRRVERKEVNK